MAGRPLQSLIPAAVRHFSLAYISSLYTIPVMCRSACKTLLLAVLIVVCACCSVHAQPDIAVTAISKDLFDKAAPLRMAYYPDRVVVKVNGRLMLPALCGVIKEDTSGDNYYSLDCVGDIDTAGRILVVKEETYNGVSYWLYDTRKDCKTYHLLGAPQVYGNIIANINESETTDRRAMVELWRVSEGGIEKLLTRRFFPARREADCIDPVELRILHGNVLAFKDSHGKYWQLKHVALK